MLYTDGSIYDGKWRNGLRHASGSYRLADKTFIVAEWYNDEPEYVKIIYNNGD